MNRVVEFNKRAELSDRFDFDIVPTVSGANKLRVPFLSVSDVHLGWFFSRADIFTHFLDCIEPDLLILNGDIIDGEFLASCGASGLEDFAHQLALSKIIEKAQDGRTIYCVGNHDLGLDAIKNETMNGLEFVGKHRYQDPAGRHVLIEHGHRHDVELDKAHQGFWHWFGDRFIQAVHSIDRDDPVTVKKILELPSDYSFAHDLKRGFGLEFLEFSDIIAHKDFKYRIQ